MTTVVFVSLLLFVSVALGQCPHTRSGLTKWSTLFGGATNTTFNIAAGQAVLLDVPPTGIVDSIDVYGELIFDNQNMELKVRLLNVRDGGKLWLGSESCPLTAKITVTFYGLTQNPKTQPALDQANKALAAYPGSHVDVHGTPRLPTWAVISATTAVGDKQIKLAQTVNWAVGDKIVIATTDFTKRYRDDNNPTLSYTASRDTTSYENTFQSEVVTITAVSGNVVSFTPALQYVHFGDYWVAPDDATKKIDMRAEVGLLTRNIIFQGDVTEGTTLADKWGGHVMATDFCDMRIEGVEFLRMGQKDNVARYPVHYHLCGNTTNNYVRRNAFHDTFQRAVTIHGSNNLQIEENVGFNVDGHMYFVEDGNEVNNTFRKNLGIQVNPHTLLNTADQKPAIFWSVSADNTWEDNVAVSGYLCYWFSFPRHPLGLADVPDYLWWNRHTAIRKFKGNKAHSCTMKGLHIDDGLTAASGTTELTSHQPIFPWQNVITPDQAQYFSTQPSYMENKLEELIAGMKPQPSLIEDFTAYKCIEHAIWGRGTGIHVVNAKLADNQVGAQFPGDRNLLEDSVIVGETQNIGMPDADRLEAMQGRNRFYRWWPEAPIAGIQHYDGGSPDIVRNTKFYNFVDFHFQFNGKIRNAAGIRQQGGRSIIPPRNKYLNVGFYQAPNHVRWLDSDPTSAYHGSEPNYVGAGIVDADGSLTGACGSSIVYPSPIMYTSQCQSRPLWNAYICPPSHKPHRHIYFEDMNTMSFPGSSEEDAFYKASSTIYRLPDHVPFLMTGQVEADYGATGYTIKRDHHSALLLTYTSYFIQWGTTRNAPAKLSIRLNYAKKEEWMRIALPYPPGTTFSFYTDSPLTPVTGLDQLNRTTYFWDNNKGLLWLHLQPKFTRYRYDYGIVTQDGTYNDPYQEITATCPNNNCTTNIDPNTVMPSGEPAIPDASVLNQCEVGANAFGGDVSVSETGSSATFFAEDINPEWDVKHYSWMAVWNYSSVMAANGQYSLAIIMNQSGVDYWRANKQILFDADQFTHFQFKVTTTPGRGEFDIGLAFKNEKGDNLDSKFSINSISDPRYCATCPADDSQFHTITIPLSDLGLGTGADLLDAIYQFSFWPARWEPFATTYFFDDIKFIKGTQSYTPTARATNNIAQNYNYAEDPYTKNPLQNLQIPGAPTAPYGSYPIGGGDNSQYNNNINNVNTQPTTTSSPGGNPISPSDNSQSGASSAASWGVPVVIVLAILFIIAAVVAIVFFKKAKGDFV